MPRRPRIAPPGIPQHVIQRGNNRQNCFICDADKKAYIHWLREYSRQFGVDIHAWVLMTNHVHLLCTPNAERATSNMMQSLGRSYVAYFNRQYERTGTLWEGRFKSCLVDRDNYLLALYRYIELNPVRAGMVERPVQYAWSSHHSNAFGRKSTLLTPHSLYQALGPSPQEQQHHYRTLFDAILENRMIQDIRECTNSGFALGQDAFKRSIEQMTGHRVSKLSRGRPKVHV